MGIFKQLFSKSDSNEIVPPSMQVEIMAGKFEAEDLLERINGHELHPEVYNIIAQGFRVKKDYGLAEEFYKKAINADNKNGDFYGNLMSLYVEAEEYDKCEQIFNEAVKKINRGHEFVYFHQARFYAMQDQLEKALSIISEGMSLSREEYEPLYFLNTQILLRLVKFMLDNGRKEEAEDIAQTAGKSVKIALHLFPDSERIQELYKDIIE